MRTTENLGYFLFVIDFLALVEDFLSRHPHISAAAYGQAAIGDPNLVRQLRGAKKHGNRKKRIPRLDTAQRVVDWMEDYERRVKEAGPQAPPPPLQPPECIPAPSATPARRGRPRRGSQDASQPAA